MRKELFLLRFETVAGGTRVFEELMHRKRAIRLRNAIRKEGRFAVIRKVSF